MLGFVCVAGDSALLEMCLADVQDVVYQTVDDTGEDYDKLKAKVVSKPSTVV